MPKIPLYPASTTPNQDDLLILEDSVTSNTKKIKRSDLLGGNIINATNNVATDTISELTAAAGVTIDGCPIKDKLIVGGAAQGVANSSLSSTAGDIGGAWASWTPTYVNMAGGTTVAKYTQIGKTIFYKLRYTFAADDISGAVTFTLPVTAVAGVATDPMGNGIILDYGTSTKAIAIARYATTTTVSLQYLVSSTTLCASLSSTAPHTWAVNDVISITGTYEAA